MSKTDFQDGGCGDFRSTQFKLIFDTEVVLLLQSEIRLKSI